MPEGIHLEHMASQLVRNAYSAWTLHCGVSCQETSLGCLLHQLADLCTIYITLKPCLQNKSGKHTVPACTLPVPACTLYPHVCCTRMYAACTRMYAVPACTLPVPACTLYPHVRCTCMYAVPACTPYPHVRCLYPHVHCTRMYAASRSA